MQQLNPSEISDIIKQRIEQLDVTSEARNEGTVVSVTDGIIRIHGLADVMYGEMIEFDGGLYGMALNLERDSVGAGRHPPAGRGGTVCDKSAALRQAARPSRTILGVVGRRCAACS